MPRAVTLTVCCHPPCGTRTTSPMRIRWLGFLTGSHSPLWLRRHTAAPRATGFWRNGQTIATGRDGPWCVRNLLSSGSSDVQLLQLGKRMPVARRHAPAHALRRVVATRLADKEFLLPLDDGAITERGYQPAQFAARH